MSSVFIEKQRNEARPEGTVEISPAKVVAFYSIVVRDWERWQDVWSMTQAPGIFGTVAGVSGYIINMSMRRKFRVMEYGYFSSALPTSIIPAGVAASYQTSALNDVFLDPLGCIICRTTKSALIQVGFGVGQALILSSFSSIFFATRHFTCRIPSLFSDTKNFFKFYFKLVRPLGPRIGVLVGINAAVGIVMTHMQVKQFLELQPKLIKTEEEVEAEEKEYRENRENMKDQKSTPKKKIFF